MTTKKYCPVCMFETIDTGQIAYCPRHGVKCIKSGEKTTLKWLG